MTRFASLVIGASKEDAMEDRQMYAEYSKKAHLEEMTDKEFQHHSHLLSLVAEYD